MDEQKEQSWDSRTRSVPHRLGTVGEQPVKPIDEQLKTSVLVADKRRGTDLKQIGRIRGEWAAAGTGEAGGCVPVGGDPSDI